MNYNLYNYFEEAQIADVPDWFRHVDLYFKDRQTKLFVPGKPRWHQITGLNLVSSFTRSGLYDDMGTGKTCIAQARIAWLAQYGNKSVCLMPPILLDQFMRSFANTFRDKDGNPGELLKHIKIEIYHGDKSKRNKQIARWEKEGYPSIVLTTYELFRKEFTLFMANKYEYVVCDEARLLSNPRTDAHVSIYKFLGDTYGDNGLLLMNGTPAMNQLVDLFGYIRLITPNIYLGLHDFYVQHVDVMEIKVKYAGRGGEIKERPIEKITGYRGKDRLYENLYKQARRVVCAQVQELPELNVETIDVELHPKHLAAYRQLVHEKVMFFDDGSMIDATNVSKLRQLCAQSVNSPTDLNVTEDSAVLQMAEELMNAANVEENKVVVFVHYRKTVLDLKERWKKLNPATIYGGADNEKERDKFLDDPTCRVAIINYQSGGVGLELQHVASKVICIEPTGVPGQFWQAIKRVHREGQNNAVMVYVLIAVGTIFAKLYSDMNEKSIDNESVVSREQFYKELLGETVVEPLAVY